MGNPLKIQQSIQSILGERVWIFVIVMTGISGYIMGIFYQQWQVALEPAQVLAGIVHYPADNPNYIYQITTWTILHQLLAILLKLGFSEIGLSKLICGIVGMLLFQSVALIVFGLSNNVVLSCLSPFLILFISHNRHFAGVTYPIMLMGYTHTYGMISLSFALLVLAFFGIGQYKIGGMLLGMSISIHPAMGIFLSLIVFIVLLLDCNYLYPRFKHAIRWIMAGYTISGISFVVYWYLLKNRYQVLAPVNDVQEYFYAFLRYWDVHRQTFDWRSFEMQKVQISLLICLYGVFCYRQYFQRASQFIFFSVLVAGIVGSIFSISYWFPQIVPYYLLILMPSRIFNINLIALVPILTGGLGKSNHNIFSRISLLLFAAGTLFLQTLSPKLIFGSTILLLIVMSQNVSNNSTQKQIFNVLTLFFVAASGVTLQINVFLVLGIGLLIFGWLQGYHHQLKLYGKCSILIMNKSFLESHVSRCIYAITIGLLGLIMIATISTGYSVWGLRQTFFRDHTNTPFWAQVSKGQGMLLTSSNLGYIQIRTRRPVLLDGLSLDGLFYSLRASHQMSVILQQVYGIDLINPPEEMKKQRGGGLLPDTGKRLWETRTPETWKQIKTSFQVNEILTYANWSLLLPLVAKDDMYALYKIE